MIAVLVTSVAATSTVGLVTWIEREVEGRGHLPALAEVLSEAEVELDLEASDGARGWTTDARWRAWIPQLDARLGTDRSLDVRDATTTSSIRTGEDFGVQVRLQWSLADALFNDSVLRADKALRERSAARWKARDQLVKLYFKRLELEMRMLERPTASALVRAARFDGLIRSATGGRVRFGARHRNPWPGRPQETR